jgi:hypothetical protein
MTTQSAKRPLTRADFDFLQPDTGVQAVIARVGEPDLKVDSGIYLLQYNLVKGGMMGLTFTDPDRLELVVYYDSSGGWQVLFQAEV